MAYMSMREDPDTMPVEFQNEVSTPYSREERIFRIQKEIQDLQRLLDQQLLEEEEEEGDVQLTNMAEISKLQSDIDAVEEELHAVIDLERLKQSELDDLHLEIEGHRAIIVMKQDRIKELRSVDLEESPQGSPTFRFVEGPAFMIVATAVIIINVATLLMEYLNHGAKDENLEVLDHFYMLFYMIEIVCKSLYWREKYLLGACTRVWWNWLDVTIVVTGIMDMYLIPGLAAMGAVTHGHSGTSFLGFMRVLRLARLVRILKVVKIFLTSDFKWCESEKFQMFITGVICLNCITIGLESDHPKLAMWKYLDNVMLGCFTFELVVRIKRWGCVFFCHREDCAWNYLDFMIVIGGVLEQWALPGFAFALSITGKKSTRASGKMGQAFLMLRMARLCRILRLVRLIKQIPQLHIVVTGMARGLQGMFWVLILAVTVLYGSAIICLKLFGHNLLGDVPDDVVDLFPTVGGSFFSMFNAMNGHYDLLAPLWVHYPVMKYFMMMFTVATSWAILSTMTAVVADSMIQATKKIEQVQASQKKKLSQKKLLKLFRKADVDGDGTLSESEFKDRLLSNEMFKLQLERTTELDERDLEYLFNYLSRKPKEKRLTPDGRELLRDEFRRRYGRDQGDELWHEAPALEKRFNQDGEALSEAQFVKRYGVERGQMLWAKGPPSTITNQFEPMISRHDFIEGLLRQTDHVTERQFMRLEKYMHDALDSIEMTVDEILECNPYLAPHPASARGSRLSLATCANGQGLIKQTSATMINQKSQSFVEL